RWRKLAAEKVAEVDAFVTQARTIRKLLSETLDFQCPKLVERGRALPSATARPALRPKHPARSARSGWGLMRSCLAPGCSRSTLRLPEGVYALRIQPDWSHDKI